MNLIWGTIVVALAIVWVITIVDIFRSHLGGKKTAAWLLIVTILPVVGAVGYWVMRKPSSGEVERMADSQRELRAQAHQRPFDSTRPGP